MMPLVEVALRVLAAAGGLVMLWLAFLARENEEAAVRDTLVRWWVVIDDSRSTMLARHWAMMGIAASRLEMALSRLLGDRLWRLSHLATSVSLVAASILALLFIAATDESCLGNCERRRVILFSGALALMGNAFGIATKKTYAVLGGAVAFGLYFGSLWAQDPRAFDNTSKLTLAVGLLGSLAAFELLLALARTSLRWITSSPSWATSAAVLVLQVVVVPFLFLGPLLLASALDLREDALMMSVALIVFSSILIGLILSAALVLINAVLVVHVAVWSALDRPLYSAVRFDVISKHRKTIGALGFTIVAGAIPGSGPVVQYLMSLL